MRPRTLAVRLTAAAAVAVAIAVAGSGVIAVLVVRHELRTSLDRSLRERAVQVARLAVSAPALLTAPGALEGPAAGRQLSVEVVDREGRIVARSLALGAKLLPTAGAGDAARVRGRASYEDVDIGETPLRVFAAPVPDAGGPAAGGAVLVAADPADVESTLRRLPRLFAVFGLLAVALGTLVAAALTRRGLRPLRRLSAAAAVIERRADPARRLPDPAGHDEVGELARTLNRMLAALDGARRRERRFLADASHELRTPLTSLAGNVEFVARHGAAPDVVADLQHDTARLQRLVADLLALEREDAAALPDEVVALDTLVREAAAGHPRVRLAEVAPVAVRGDAGALRRALDNLVENAEVHGPPDGEVVLALVREAGRARLSVTDEGAGFTGEDAARAFERFWRGAEAHGRPGSGLGLSIVRATAERHGGRVTADGPTVTIDLPASREPAAIA